MALTPGPPRMTASVPARKSWPMVRVPPSGELIVTCRPVCAIEPMRDRLALVGADRVGPAEVERHLPGPLVLELDRADDPGGEVVELAADQALVGRRELRPVLLGAADVGRAGRQAGPLDVRQVAVIDAADRRVAADVGPRRRAALVEVRVARGQSHGCR